MSSSSRQRRHGPGSRGRSNSPRSSGKPYGNFGDNEASPNRGRAAADPAEVIEARLIDRQKELIREIEADIWSLKYGKAALDSSGSTGIAMPSTATAKSAAAVATAVTSGAQPLPAAPPGQAPDGEASRFNGAESLGDAESAAFKVMNELYNHHSAQQQLRSPKEAPSLSTSGQSTPAIVSVLTNPSLPAASAAGTSAAGVSSSVPSEAGSHKVAMQSRPINRPALQPARLPQAIPQLSPSRSMPMLQSPSPSPSASPLGLPVGRAMPQAYAAALRAPAGAPRYVFQPGAAVA